MSVHSAPQGRSIPVEGVADLTFSAGPDQECWHEPISRIAFPHEQNLYGRAWDLVVTDLAGHYHYNNDGWEASWPLQIRIYEGDAEVARFEVEREYDPTFYAWPVPIIAGNEADRRSKPK